MADTQLRGEPQTGGKLSSRSNRLAVRPVWFGIAFLAVLTASFTAFFHANLFAYNTFLLACIGAVALSLLVGTTGILSLGNATFMSIGAFGTVLAKNAGLGMPLDIVVGAVIAGVAGLIIGSTAARLVGFHMALATLAGFFIVNYLTYHYQTSSDQGGAAGFIFPTLYESRGLLGGQQAWAWTLFLVVAVVLFIVTRLTRERSGRALRMVRDHPIAAATLGIRNTRYKLTVFAVSSFLIGAQGGLFAYLMGSATTTSFTLALSINYLAMVLVGGADSVAGAVIGAGLITMIPVVVPDVVSRLGATGATTGAAISTVVAGALLVIFIAVAPSGIAGYVRRAVDGVRMRRAR